MSVFDSDVFVLKNGGRRDFWVSQVDTIERYIKSAGNELVRIRVAAHAEAGAPAAATGRTILWDPTRGGMRMPHLHYAGEIYMLNESQWAAFSKSAMAALVDKLNKVQKVTFDNVMQVSEALARM